MFKKHLIWIGLATLVLALNAFFVFKGQEEIVSFIGLENIYAVTFLIGLITGLSSLTGVAFPTAVMNFAAGGADVFWLTVFGGMGVFISDSLFYYFIFQGKNFVPENLGPFMRKVERFVERYNKNLILFLVFLYLVFSPFPNDLMVIVLVIAGYKYRDIVVPLFFGSLGYALFYALVGIWAF